MPRLEDVALLGEDNNFWGFIFDGRVCVDWTSSTSEGEEVDNQK